MELSLSKSAKIPLGFIRISLDGFSDSVKLLFLGLNFVLEDLVCGFEVLMDNLRLVLEDIFDYSPQMLYQAIFKVD